MSNEINTIIMEGLIERAEPFKKYVGSSWDDFVLAVDSWDFDKATELAERFENEVPLILDGRYGEN